MGPVKVTTERLQRRLKFPSVAPKTQHSQIKSRMPLHFPGSSLSRQTSWLSRGTLTGAGLVIQVSKSMSLSITPPCSCPASRPKKEPGDNDRDIHGPLDRRPYTSEARSRSNTPLYGAGGDRYSMTIFTTGAGGRTRPLMGGTDVSSVTRATSRWDNCAPHSPSG